MARSANSSGTARAQNLSGQGSKLLGDDGSTVVGIELVVRVRPVEVHVAIVSVTVEDEIPKLPVYVQNTIYITVP